jgi:hypothetical protein
LVVDADPSLRWNDPLADNQDSAASKPSTPDVVADGVTFDGAGTASVDDGAVQSEYESAPEDLSTPGTNGPVALNLRAIDSPAPAVTSDEVERSSSVDVATDSSTSADAASLARASQDCDRPDERHEMAVLAKIVPTTIGTGYPSFGQKSWMAFNRSKDTSHHLRAQLGGTWADGTATDIGGYWSKTTGNARSSGAAFTWAKKDYRRSYRIQVEYRRYNIYWGNCPSSSPSEDFPILSGNHSPIATYWKAVRITSVPAAENRDIDLPNFGTTSGQVTGMDTCQQAGSDGFWHRYMSKHNSYEFDAGVKLSTAGSIDTTVKRAYNRQAQLYYSVKKGVWLNGNNDVPDFAGKIREAQQPGDGCVFS